MEADCWEEFHRDELLRCERHVDRELFHGAVFVKVTGHFPKAKIDQVAHCFMNFADRKGLDATIYRKDDRPTVG